MKCPYCDKNELATFDIDGMCPECRNKAMNTKGLNNFPNGWGCPNCGSIYAPWISECLNCNSKTTVATTSD